MTAGAGTVAPASGTALHQHHHHHHDYGPSYSGTVMLDVGPGYGALVIYATAAELGLEIEISPSDGGARTHAAVRARHVDRRTLYGVVFPSLAAGTYTIWLDAGTPLATVRVGSAEVTEFTWPAESAGSPPVR